jgi:hypothetical protein
MGITTMLLVVYDAQQEKAFYLDLQTYFREKVIKNNKNRKFVRVYVPAEQVFTAKSIQLFNKNNVNGR